MTPTRPLKKGPLRKPRAVQFSPPTQPTTLHMSHLCFKRPIPDASTKKPAAARVSPSVEMLPKSGKYCMGGRACVAPATLHPPRAAAATRACRRRSQPSTLRVVAHVLKQGHAPRAPMEPPAVSRTASEGMERLPGKSCATCCTIFSIFCILILVSDSLSC